MNQSSESPSKKSGKLYGQRLSAEFAELTGTVEAAQRLAGQMAQLGGSFGGTERYVAQLAEITEAVGAAQRLAGQMAQLGGSFGGTERCVAQLAEITETVGAAQRLVRRQMHSTLESGTIVERCVAHLSKMVTPSVDLDWLLESSAFSEADLFGAMNRLSADWRGQNAGLLDTLSESTRRGLPADALSPLAVWAESKISGKCQPFEQPFAKAAEAFASVELDDESENQLERLATDELAIKSIVSVWGLRMVPKTREDFMVLSVLAGYTAFLFLFVGFVAAPVVTGIITASIGGGVATGKAFQQLVIRFSPEAREQLEESNNSSRQD